MHAFFFVYLDFRFGQMYKSPRDADAGVADADPIYVTNTTKGYLSDGNSHKITVNGGNGGDTFDVLRNKDILDLNGQSGNDIFVVRSFVHLEYEDGDKTTAPDLEDLGVNAGEDDDLMDIKGDFSAKEDDPDYVVNSLVDIDGGTGKDRLIVVGTEYDDSYVVSDGKVYGGGLSINFNSIESVEVTAAAGNDLISVLSTSPNFGTTIYGGLGSDTFKICPREVDPVISKNLRGHRGIIEHSVSTDADAKDDYTGLIVEGIPVEIHDNDGEYAYVTVYEKDTTHVMDEDGTVFTDTGTAEYFSFWVYPTRAPENGDLVVSVLSPNTGDADANAYFYFTAPTDGIDGREKVSIDLKWGAGVMTPKEVQVRYNSVAERINTTDAFLMITLDVVDLETTALYFRETEQSIQPVNVKLLPQKANGNAMSVTVVPPSDGKWPKSSHCKEYLLKLD